MLESFCIHFHPKTFEIILRNIQWIYDNEEVDSFSLEEDHLYVWIKLKTTDDVVKNKEYYT